ncbi:MAG TPA: SDR family oxidoreductase, partial [Puia sp.]|nr:SDR family oxidoreductase [Puia sp.]
MILQNKNAVIYGAGGSLGGAVSRAFAKAGARVFLTGHRVTSIQKVAEEIRAEGGTAHIAEVDGYDASAVARHLEEIVRTTGHIDVSFNAVDIPVVQNIPLVDIPTEDIVRPVELTVRTRMITAKAAATFMKAQGSGVILFLTATPGGIGYPFTGGFAAANAAVETLSKNLAAELGIYGIRVVTVRSGGSPDSAVFQQAIKA